MADSAPPKFTFGQRLVGALVVGLYLGASLGFLMSPVLNDFGIFYASGQAWLHGVDLYFPNLPFWVQHGRIMGFPPLNLNPPLITAAFVPFALLPLKAAGLIWLALNTAALAFIWKIAVRETAASPLTALVVMVCSGASVAALWAGQLAWLLAVPMTLAWRAARRGDWMRAGVWLGACAYVKPFLLIFALQFVLRRRYRPAFILVSTFVAMGCAGLLLFGVAAHLSWLRAIGSVTWPGNFVNMSMLGLLARLHPVTPTTRVLWIAASAALGVITLVSIRTKDTTADREFLALLLLALLVVPTGWVYYLVLGAGPILALLPRLSHGRLAPSLYALAWPPLVLSHQPGWLVNATIYSVYAWSGLGLWAMTVSRTTTVASEHHAPAETADLSM